MSIEWSDKLSVGIPSMDEQHKKLVAMINVVNEKMLQGRIADVESQVIKDLIAYTKEHFRDEESVMRCNGFVGLEEHKKMHDDLRNQVAEMGEFVKQQPVIGTMKLASFLNSWLTGHILKEDKKYGVALAGKKGVK